MSKPPKVLIVEDSDDDAKLALLARLAPALERELEGAQMRAAHRRAQEALTDSEAKLRELIEDREHLARDLHDNIVQAIYAIGMRLEACHGLVGDRPDEVRAQLAHVIDALNSVIRDVRGYIAGSLRQFPLERQLSAELEQLVAANQSAEAPRVQLDVDDIAIEQLTRDDAEQVLNIAREALSNCLRHARARHGIIALCFADGGICLEISDDGEGFDSRLTTHEGGGLHNMRNRARQIGAEFELLSAPGQGTRIIVRIPRRRKVDDRG